MFPQTTICLLFSLVCFNILWFDKTAYARDNSESTKLFLSRSAIALKKKKPKTSFSSPSTINIADNLSDPAVEPTSSIPGSPSLRRTPLEGELQFEPERIPLQIPQRQYYRASPSVTIINPSGYGAFWGVAGIGVGLQDRARLTNKADGVIGLGFGLGNPQTNVGLQLGVTLVDASDPLQDGLVNIKLHRRLPYDSSIAFGVQGLLDWGEPDGGSSVYGSLTKRFILKPDRSQSFSEIYTSVGVGGGQFRSEFDIENGIETVGVFGSIAVRAIESVNIITEWTGQDLTIGASFVPFRNLPLVIVPAVTDITGQAGDGVRFILGVGYSFSY
ncbi:hypothetical protein IQ238_22325 [Pleurocapsales cyanobacterium LEGE 06147]|nr:hypothetical protein [Pleurocapsales cyanobacterium LEGE 06147]